MFTYHIVTDVACTVGWASVQIILDWEERLFISIGRRWPANREEKLSPPWRPWRALGGKTFSSLTWAAVGRENFLLLVVVGGLCDEPAYARTDVALVRTSINQWERGECYCGNKKIMNVQKIMSLESTRPGNSRVSTRLVLRPPSRWALTCEHCRVTVMFHDDTWLRMMNKLHE